MFSQVVGPKPRLRTAVSALIALAALGGLTACGGSDAPTGPPQAAAPAPPAQKLPPRPRELKVDGVDPCSLVTPQIRAQAGVTSQGQADPSSTDNALRGCGYDNFPQHPTAALDVNLATNQDTSGFLFFPDAVASTVAGFGAVDSPDSAAGADHSCVVRVDVAENQGLWVSLYNTLGDDTAATHAQMCQRAHTVAESIMAGLLAKR
jgi:predicted small lipoprotein YifL